MQENIHNDSQTGEWNWAAILQDYVSIKLPVIFCIERSKRFFDWFLKKKYANGIILRNL